jgi:hypothetical protein
LDQNIFWHSTPYEIRLVIKAITENRRADNEAAILRAGIVASAVYNVHRKKGAKAIEPKDFLPQKPLTPEEQRQRMLAWAMSRQEIDE